jgi:hypothetical protein
MPKVKIDKSRYYYVWKIINDDKVWVKVRKRTWLWPFRYGLQYTHVKRLDNESTPEFVSRVHYIAREKCKEYATNEEKTSSVGAAMKKEEYHYIAPTVSPNSSKSEWRTPCYHYTGTGMKEMKP